VTLDEAVALLAAREGAPAKSKRRAPRAKARA